MKEFIKTVKQTFQVGKGELLVFNLIALVGGVVGTVIWLSIMATGEADGEYGTIGAIMALMLGMLVMTIAGIFSMQQDFNLAISLGKTRKQYVPARYLLIAVNCSLCLIIALIICLIEETLYTAINPGAVCEISIQGFLTNPVTIFGFVFLIPMIIMLCGALYLRFGMKFFWVGWVFWMLGCTLLPRILSAAHDEADSVWKRMGMAVMDFFVNLNNVKAVIGILVLGVLGLAVAFRLLCKQRVTA